MRQLLFGAVGEFLVSGIEDSDIGLGTDARAVSLGGAVGPQLGTVPVVGAGFDVREPNGVLHHVGKDVQGLGPGAPLKVPACLLDGLNQVGVAHSRVARLARQVVDASD